MLIVKLQEATYTFPILSGELKGRFTLDENWRELDYAQGGSALNLGIQLCFGVTKDLSEDHALQEQSMIQLEKDSLVVLELELAHTDFDCESQRARATGTVPLFPRLSDLSKSELPVSILESSTLCFPLTGGLVDFDAISFGDYHRGLIDFSCLGRSQDWNLGVIKAELTCELEAEIRAYPGVFEGWSLDSKFQEIEDCFGTLYDLSAFETERKVLNDQDGDVVVVFREK